MSQHLVSFLELSDMNCLIWLISSNIYMIRILRTTSLGLYILWNINYNRSRFSSSSNLESHLDNLAQILSILYSHSILGDASGHSYDIHFLKSIISYKILWYLSRKYNKRNTIIMCISNTCYSIGSSRTTCHKADSHLSGGSCITFSLMY